MQALRLGQQPVQSHRFQAGPLRRASNFRTLGAVISGAEAPSVNGANSTPVYPHSTAKWMPFRAANREKSRYKLRVSCGFVLLIAHPGSTYHSWEQARGAYVTTVRANGDWLDKSRFVARHSRIDSAANSRKGS